MMRFQQARIQKGFTLIEVIAALAIIGLGLVGILSLFPVGIDASKRAGDLTNATVLGQSVLTQIRAGARSGELSLSEAKSAFASSGGVFKDFDQPLSNKIIPVEDQEDQYIPKVTADGKERTLYQYQVSFEDVPKETKLDDLTRVGLQKVTVTVSWPATEPTIELRNRATLVTFIRFPTPR